MCKNKGFTLIEFLVVFAILILLSSIAIPAMLGPSKEEIEASRKAYELNHKEAAPQASPLISQSKPSSFETCLLSVRRITFVWQEEDTDYSRDIDVPSKFAIGVENEYCLENIPGRRVYYLSSNQSVEVPSFEYCTISEPYNVEYPEYVCNNVALMDHWDRDEAFKKPS